MGYHTETTSNGSVVTGCACDQEGTTPEQCPITAKYRAEIQQGLENDFDKFLQSPEPPISDLDVMKAIIEDWEDRDSEEPGITFEEVLQDYYGNLLDDLHDSQGDREYQQGLLEQMQAIERWADSFTNPESPFHLTRFTLADKAPDIQWFFGEGEVR